MPTVDVVDLNNQKVGELELERLRTQMASFNAQRVDA